MSACALPCTRAVASSYMRLCVAAIKLSHQYVKPVSMRLADPSSSDHPEFRYLAVNLFFLISFPPRQPRVCLFSMLSYYSIIPLLLYALRASSLSIHPASVSFAVQYNHLLNYTSAINQTNPPDYIECPKIDRPNLPAPDPTVCTAIKRAACEPFNPDFPFPVWRDRWVWRSLEGCSLAFYMPGDADKSMLPSVDECQRNIYGAMIETCAQRTGQYNLGTINVDTPPDPSWEGLPLTDGYPRYLMAYEQLDS